MEITSRISVVNEPQKSLLMSERAVWGEEVALTRQQTPNSAFRPSKISHKKVSHTKD